MEGSTAVVRFARAGLGVSVILAASVATAQSVSESSLGLPRDAPRPNASSELIALGRELFHDPRLSADGKVSCATCHVPALAFADGKVHSIGAFGRKGTRNAPSLLNVKLNSTLFWDGRRASLEQQAADPMVNAFEHGLASPEEALQRVKADPHYLHRFRATMSVRARELKFSHIARALAAFERSLESGNSAFDRYLYGGDKNALSESARRGLELFRGRAKCSECHTLNEQFATFSDQQFHGVGVGLARIQSRLPELTRTVLQSTHPIDLLIRDDPDVGELGRFLITHEPKDIGKFRTPSLRNVAVTPPYMHDGSVATLQEAVEREIYYRSLEDGRPLILTAEEKTAIIEFLVALTSPQYARLLQRR